TCGGLLPRERIICLLVSQNSSIRESVRGGKGENGYFWISTSVDCRSEEIAHSAM
ncbi:unnamed protein product, partial [Litomosoides sigmodontis]